ncbi:MAG TPA: AgmX/PglI C-terminal domain-containing protein [Myxococcota bacterium]|nr:AgmX/PglI C-terminal domain-containing protein [Myxococcota bacterium]HRY93533.1 AgmX/PglI C-terminal domain-containing protein [Myxococcota bacterium]HSA20554.1 AgmX/PglI C-terminal domain-containing protein [Myxococcota bacterium]
MGAGERLLEVAVRWGRSTLAVRHHRAGERVVLGQGAPEALGVPGLALPAPAWTLVEALGEDGARLRLAAGMGFSVRAGGRPVELGLPAGLSDFGWELRPGQEARVGLGQAEVRLRWVPAARPARGAGLRGRDSSAGAWLASACLVALGVWAMIQATPGQAREADAYLVSPGRLASLAPPAAPERARPRFALIEEAQPRARPVRAAPRRRPEGAAAVLRPEERRRRDEQVVADAGILALLRQRGGGGPGGNLLGGAQPADLDAQLAQLAGPSGPPGGGVGAPGLRGGPPGGAPLGLGGDGRWSGGPDGGPAMDQAPLDHRERLGVEVDERRTRILGGLPRGVVAAHMQAHWLQFKYCYEQQLGRTPDLRGKVVTTFTIGPEGRVAEASVLQSTAESADLEACLLRSLRRLRFPRPRGGGEVLVTYPFLFHSVQ